MIWRSDGELADGTHTDTADSTPDTTHIYLPLPEQTIKMESGRGREREREGEKKRTPQPHSKQLGLLQCKTQHLDHLSTRAHLTVKN